ncbi:uncharacterized protein sS8_4272 [Methylocaldum marinum]|uniref:Gp5/Type VI secretion system Vgr protein OB-fold domain-containing protein n=1 Tax=Methylocaldum marinum TaxID=1432792 RepID=A0A250KX76_9GAMM|nr:phage baseplate assembly protein V [Methylocaldum marinum]BBA36202.1 uncharacterized protein sS8_4272 [Methylocaldum marinum]
MNDVTANAAEGRTQYYGKYRGTVVDNVDPNKRGRLQVTVPAVLDTKQVWAMPCVPYAGPSLGFYAMPEVGTGVWIEFEAGDVSYPIWTGCFWAENDVDQADADPRIKFFKTRKFTLRIDDGNGEIIIENDSGSQIKLTAQEILHKSSTVRQEAAGGRKTELSAASYKVNDGAMEVL